MEEKSIVLPNAVYALFLRKDHKLRKKELN